MKSVDPRTMHVLIHDENTHQWEDRTWKIATARRERDRIVITYTTSTREYHYGEDRARLYDQVERHDIDALDEVRVRGKRWNNVESIWTLRHPGNPDDPR